MNTIGRCIAVAATTLMASGCAANATTAKGPLPPGEDATTIRVENYNWADMVVYAVRHNTRVRLGTVTSMNHQSFPLPRGMDLGSVDLVAEPIGSRASFRTGPINVNPGQQVELKLQNLLSVSSWSVW